MMVPRRALSAVLLVAGLAALLALASCATRVVRPIDEPPPPPFPSSPERTLQLLEWCYDYRSMPMHRTLFTADYRFFFSPMDSSGVDFRAVPWTRDDELTYFIHLVNGGAGAYPAKSIDLELDRRFIVLPDVRYPWDLAGHWHKKIETQMHLRVYTTAGDLIDIQGAGRFFFVRGDSAAIPTDLGVGPDSTRWYIQQWDDETLPPFRTSTVAGPGVSWGAIKALYRRFAPD